LGEVIATGPLIDGVTIRPLKRIGDDRGSVLHMVRADGPEFEGFGEIYFSTVKRGTIKAWRRHKRMIQHFAVPSGEILLVLFDDRPGSATRGAVQEIRTGADHYGLIRVPPGLWYGFRGEGAQSAAESLIANCASIPHDPEEIERLPEDAPQIPYRWG